MVPIPSEADEEARRAYREREDLTGERRSIVNKIDGILATLGIKGYKALRRDRREQLNCARQPDGDPIPPKAKARIERLLDQLDLVLKRALGGYVGLGGTPFSSGGSEREQGIGKDGNARVRAAMVELAWMLMARSANGCARPALASPGSSSSAAMLLSASRSETSASGPWSSSPPSARPDRHHQDGRLSGRERSSNATATSLRPCRSRGANPAP